MENSRKSIYVLKNLFLFGPLAISLIFSQMENYYLFIFVSLLLIANAQLRNLVKNQKLLIASLLIDLPIVLYTMSTSRTYIYFILFASLIDIILKMENDRTILSIYFTVGYYYILFYWYNLEFSAVLSIFYIGFLFMLKQLQLEFQSKKDIEALYDQIRLKNHELEIAKSSLQSYSKQVEKVTQLEERNRISRELHDTIGHSLTGILFQVDAAKKMMIHDKVKGLELLDAAYKNISNSIESVRKTVRKLRPHTYQTFTSTLHKLVTQFSQNTNIQIDFQMVGTPYEIYPSVEITIYRSIQEALTNSVRHGHAKNIAIHLTFERHSIELTIKDDGVGSKDISFGLGLSGMKERLEVIGGRLQVTSEDGFSIYIYIPLTEV